MPYAILRMSKHKGGGITAIEKHHEREKESYQSNPDIELSRTPDNYHIKAPEGKYVWEVQRRIEAAKCRVRSDSVKMIDTMIAATPEFVQALPAQEQRTFFQHAFDFMKQKIGEENIFSAVVHMDEATPHMHICFVPLTRDKRLSAKELLGNKAGLRCWQDEFYAHMSARWPMLDRGAPAHETNRQHLSTQEFKVKEQSREVYALQRENARLRRKLERIPYPLLKKMYEQEQQKKKELTR
jgi:hypothetical protein